MNERCGQVQTLFTKQGVRSCIFKGQANLPFYPSELSSLRQSGDIDICETHAHLDVFEDVEVEAHYRPELV